KFLWALKFESIFCEANGITVDGSGNIYITGSFNGIATFGNITLTSAGDSDAFVAKLDSNGKFLSAQNFGGTLADTGLDITSDAKGNIYATGGFENTATFGNTSLTSAGSIDAFIVKLGDEVGETQITLIPNNTDSVFNLNGAATPIQ
ncbi:MAG: SBBP repeat-containing protein, partial [bacterium]